ncbi:MAG: GntP family permease [Marinilabiliales bacterium]|nr:GntP family permease [Marinilabiliales bacterium]
MCNRRNTCRQKFGQGQASWAMMFTGFIVAIPVFFDVGLIILYSDSSMRWEELPANRSCSMGYRRSQDRAFTAPASLFF